MPPPRVLSPETEDNASKNGSGNKAKRRKYTHGAGNIKTLKRSPENKSAKPSGPTRSNKKNAADVLASVGEIGVGEPGGNDGAGEQGDDEEEYEFESESSKIYRPKQDSDIEMEGEAGLKDGPDGDKSPECEGMADEEDIVASLYEEEGVGDDTLYRKLLSMIQDLANDHKLLHEKIAELTVRLDRKEDVSRKAADSRKAANSRRATDVEMEGYIRQAILALLGRKTRKELLSDGPPDNIAAPSESMFYVKWTEREKSQFNKVAANVVATNVIQDWPALCSEDDRDSIRDMATQDIRYLIKLYKRQRLPLSDPKEAARRLQCSVDTQRRTLFEQWLKTVLAIKGLEKHRQLIVELGIQGTSSDEEDKNNSGHYLVKQCKELSNET
ncbi:hypothetical protein FRC10_000303 [Ceratobasidium sp. 414]|nr:hypothetical protein FRC10_000303 [Ceratobasidium sp. 414]